MQNRRKIIQAEPKSGRGWVTRYLLPRLDAHPRQMLRCLHFGFTCDEEVQALRESGRHCEFASWNGKTLDAPAREFDLVFGGHFGALAGPGEPRRKLAAEISRVTGRPGAVLLTVANGASVLDLSANAGLIHLPGAPGTMQAEELRYLFVESGFFGDLHRLSLAGHFGWGRLPRLFRPVERWLERYTTWASDPDHPRRYTSLLNPVMNFWISR